MNTAMVNEPKRVILDTNILVSALVFGGKPEQILKSALENKIQVIISPILLAEFTDIIHKKFPLSTHDFQLLEVEISDLFEVINPSNTINVLSDDPDNRVLEAAVEGGCQYIISGDKGLLKLKTYEGINILTADEFLTTIDDSLT